MTKIEWRHFTIEDWPYILAMHIDQELALGRKMDLPNLAERPVVSAYVGRKNGKIVACVFAEAELEICALGASPLAKKDVEEVSKLLIRDAQYYQIRLARAFVPVKALKPKRRAWRKDRPAPVARILEAAKFTEVDETMVDFYRWIPQAKRAGR